MTDGNSIQKRAVREEEKVENFIEGNKIQKTKEEINHEFIHRIVMKDLEIPHIREMYTKRGISFADAYQARYKEYLKPQPSSMVSKYVDGVMKYEVYDYEGNILDPNEEDVQRFIQFNIDAESGLG